MTLQGLLISFLSVLNGDCSISGMVWPINTKFCLSKASFSQMVKIIRGQVFIITEFHIHNTKYLADKAFF